MKSLRIVGLVAVAAVMVASGPNAALAKGGFRGTFGNTAFRAWTRTTTCEYLTSTGFFQITGVSKPKIHLSSRTADLKWAQIGGAAGADPTAPGAVFPIVLTSSEAGFVNASGVGIGTDPKSVPGWTTEGGDTFTITFTGYKKGKIVGTFAGTLQPGIDNANGPIDASGSFAAKCIVQ